MKAIILAGGYGTRLSEFTTRIPKPLVQVGDMPIIWHIMKHLSHYGINEFILTLGYKSEAFKNFFLNYHHRQNNLMVDTGTGDVHVQAKKNAKDDWKVHLIDTGANSETGSRVAQAMDYVGEERVFLTYGDGLSNIDVPKLIAFHEDKNLKATVSCVEPPAKFGLTTIDDGVLTRFSEKEYGARNWINGGFMILEPEVRSYIADGGSEIFERGALPRLSKDGQLAAYQHDGFWRCLDTAYHKKILDDEWDAGEAPWKVWD